MGVPSDSLLMCYVSLSYVPMMFPQVGNLHLDVDVCIFIFVCWNAMFTKLNLIKKNLAVVAHFVLFLYHFQDVMCTYC